jgi:acetyl esterase/lipase
VSTPFRYGGAASQVADLYVPDGQDGGRRPVVVLVHGGYWRPVYDRSLMRPLALDVVRRGFTAWNVDYRASGAGGGGWPRTFEDVAAAVDLLADVAADHPVDLDRVVMVGHSAGGTLALWAAGRPGLPAGAPGHDPSVRARAAVSLAGVNDLAAGFVEGLGSGAVEALMGGAPEDDRPAYSLASPVDRLPIGVRQLLVHGSDDDVVPPSQSRTYAAAAGAAGDPVELVEIDGADHFDVIDPAHDAWRRVADRLPDLCG